MVRVDANLANLIASAADLVATDQLEQHKAEGIHASSPVDPPCTEPYCGGFFWSQQPSPPPRIDGEVEIPRDAAYTVEKDTVAVTGPFCKTVGKEVIKTERACEDAAKMLGKVYGGADSWCEQYGATPACSVWPEDGKIYFNRDIDCDGRGANEDSQLVCEEPEVAPDHPVRLDYPDVTFYPPLDPPVARQVKIMPAHRGSPDPFGVPNGVSFSLKSRRELRFLLNEVLNPFMRVREDALMGKHEQLLREGLQLISWKEKYGRPHTTPHLGSREDLLKAKLPVQFAFGGKPTYPTTVAPGQQKSPTIDDLTPDLPDLGAMMRAKDQSPLVLPVKRLDFVLKHGAQGAQLSSLPEDAMILLAALNTASRESHVTCPVAVRVRRARLSLLGWRDFLG
eukprot:TRINITY_DN62420_c0_g1_i1.p1 TRINITY_DN62420_c0_g1~~TRINITY_DN62420_c0_g1_i1.p1  ORF type:complete len:395 (-),score=59.06 TRINITY_DN62420_c0_g1_i1:19-1203(-)